MPRLIDADKVADFVCFVCGENCDDECRRVCLERQFTEKCTEKMPTEDAEPVVRCKDCIHYWKNKPSDNVPVCLASPKDDAYCSEGERKEDE